MIKNWLIRTKNNHILGPVSKDKIKELISNGTIKGDDEICSGNGYWIYVREQDLVVKYVLGDDKQLFNPVQEAGPCEIDIYPPENENVFPEDADLEFPDGSSDDSKNVELVSEPDDITTVNLNLDNIKENVDEQLQVEGEEVQADDVSTQKASVTHKLKPRPKRIIKNPQVTPVKKKGNISVYILYFLAILFLIIAVISFKYKKTILEQLNSNVSKTTKISSLFISSAIAQDNSQNTKKKNG